MNISRIDMARLKNLSKQKRNLEEVRDELWMSLTGGAIDYSKDKIQTTPTNNLEEVMARIDEIDRRIDFLIDEIRKYKDVIYAMNTDKYVNVLVDLYIELKSFKQIATSLKKTKSTIFERHEGALIEYYYTKYCGRD